MAHLLAGRQNSRRQPIQPGRGCKNDAEKWRVRPLKLRFSQAADMQGNSNSPVPTPMVQFPRRKIDVAALQVSRSDERGSPKGRGIPAIAGRSALARNCSAHGPGIGDGAKFAGTRSNRKAHVGIGAALARVATGAFYSPCPLIATYGKNLDLDWIRNEWRTIESADDPRMRRLEQLVANQRCGPESSSC